MHSIPSQYDQIRFDSLPSPERHIRRLETIGQLFGLSPESIDRCRVLDIGCGSGKLLLAMACEAPNSTFIGVDSSASHIESAEAARKALGLSNISFRLGDLSVSSGDEPFHYILSFGVFSWVAREVQEQLLQRISALLAPNGIASVSFNPWPGFQRQEILKHGLRMSIPSSSTPSNQVEAARSLLGAAKDLIQDSSTTYTMALREEIEQLMKQSDSYLVHGLLAPDVSSTPLKEFVAHSARHGLNFLCDARPALWKAERFHVIDKAGSKMTELTQFAPDQTALECLLDLLIPAQLRTALLLKADAGSLKPNRMRIKDLHVASQLVRPAFSSAEYLGEATFYTPGGGEIEVRDERFQNVLLTLSQAWPESIPVSELCSSLGISEEALSEQLYGWYLQEVVELDASPPSVSKELPARPCVHPLAGYQARTDEWVTTYRHGYLPLDLFARALCFRCDGTRTREELADQLIEDKGGELPEGITRKDVVDAISELLGHFGEAALLKA